MEKSSSFQIEQRNVWRVRRSNIHGTLAMVILILHISFHSRSYYCLIAMIMKQTKALAVSRWLELCDIVQLNNSTRAGVSAAHMTLTTEGENFDFDIS